ncbi:MAG: 5'-methylthioadenosine/S-adenosylhomocysteine nucleosidase, partial [Clostridium sp.]|nr:5'-methylthioadenosine/S-adenosylhomocysteine nucleosidase [Clostridium sp.]
VVSGDQFISSKEVKERLISTFQGDCAEMEGASIAHGAYLNGIPFVIIRAISDKADDSAEMDYPTFEKEAAKHSARLVEDLVAAI